ncbi:MBL fold metallo-hydrolase [Gordonia sp. X0973]|uniref:MBL fold metallo-hydrolase n=1 Tax=Gordonia sp. X0973 TaxID=2742602 RepID=UPI000F52A70C|nr:MBL fold metallo-hydrolase [Gordonia sp. X0973]QKT07261.1 MBL fold metallo-hydrolase [Gordonia sp. X0973]
MLITGFPAGMFQTNCYIVSGDAVAGGSGGDAVVIDPGQESAAQVQKLCAEHGLTPVAVLLTHGHLDHTWNAAQVCEEYGIPCYIHPADRPMLTDPSKGIGKTLGAVVGVLTFHEPEKVVEFGDEDEVELAGLRFSVELAPGHTQGSVLLGLDVPLDDAAAEGGADAGSARVVFSGDVLFQGSIGRTDLPGGDHQQLLDSIAARLLPLPDDTLVLPGHGPQTTIGTERANNPFLAGLGGHEGGAQGPSKGRYGL